jgi:hypothetical protein
MSLTAIRSEVASLFAEGRPTGAGEPTRAPRQELRARAEPNHLGQGSLLASGSWLVKIGQA